MIHFNPPFKFKLLPVKSVTVGGRGTCGLAGTFLLVVFIFLRFLFYRAWLPDRDLPASSQAGSATDVLEY